MNNLQKLSITLITMFVSSPAYSHCDHGKYYVGGGVGLNSESENNSEEAKGYQFLGGYCLPYKLSKVKSTTSIELGYMSSGNFDSQSTKFNNNPRKATQTRSQRRSYEGVWVAGVAEYKFESKLNFMARLGYDIGDDNGFLVGWGVGYNVNRRAQVRAEYITRNDVDSVQFNWVSEF